MAIDLDSYKSYTRVATVDMRLSLLKYSALYGLSFRRKYSGLTHLSPEAGDKVLEV